MTDVRSLRVFLGSSITELEEERVRISDSISQDLSRLFEQDNIIIQFLKCEGIHEGNSGQHDQKKIEAMLRTCDVSLFLFKDKEGEYTLQEYKVARALQNERKHKIYVYYLHEGEEKKPEKQTPFQEELKKDGVFWKSCDSLSDLKYQFAIGLLKDLGVRCGETVRAASEVKKDAEAIFEQFQENRQLMHQEIEKLLAQVDPVMKDTDTPISARITQVMGLYHKADLWASKTDYDKEKYSDLLSDYARFLNEYGLYRDAEAVYLRQIQLAEELYGKEHEKTATSYNIIGLVFMKQHHDSWALEYFEKALAITKKTHGTEHLDTALSYTYIGFALMHLFDNSNALKYLFKALTIKEKVLGTEHPDTASSYNNIGLVYHDQCDYPKALEYYTKALSIREKVLGVDHPDTAISYNNIGAVYGYQGNHSKALTYLFKALAIMEKVLGTEHPDIADSYNIIGSVYHHQGDYSKALEYYFKALAVAEKKDPYNDHYYRNIGSVYENLGNYTKALEYKEKALEIREKVLGTDDSSTLIDYSNLSNMYLFKMQDYSKGLEYFEKALQIKKWKKMLGENHPFVTNLQESIDFINKTR